jgi:hypothetical protein
MRLRRRSRISIHRMEPRRAFLKDTEAVAYLHERGVDLSPATMKNWRSYGKSGLRFHRIAGKIYYSVADIESWLNQSRFAEGGRRDPLPMTAAAQAEAAAQREGNA